MANNKDSGRVVFAHITIGLQLAITMLIFVYGGHRLDLYFDKSPLFLVIGTVFGMCLGFYHLLKDLHVGNKKDEHPKCEDEPIKKRIKWN
ncbi:MAG TPA: AtpZ/AtpI family protein [Spirochaetota bacterium]|nr:AtpZ/AtpI family protein [Spirochaetota bacterium]HPS88133.1 AtpZ/AtpI family protein [Spirochaetota bacterium]